MRNHRNALATSKAARQLGHGGPIVRVDKIHALDDAAQRATLRPGAGVMRVQVVGRVGHPAARFLEAGQQPERVAQPQPSAQVGQRAGCGEA